MEIIMNVVNGMEEIVQEIKEYHIKISYRKRVFFILLFPTYQKYWILHAYVSVIKGLSVGDL